MIHLSAPFSFHPSSFRVATTTATGPRACLPLPLSSSPFLLVLPTSCCQTAFKSATASGWKNIRFAHPWTTLD
eukprot:10943308-Heterocapsa_arctica.AAC.1